MSGDQEPHTNGLNGDASDDEDQKDMRPVDIEADVKEMERRKRVEAIMNSQVRYKIKLWRRKNPTEMSKHIKFTSLFFLDILSLT